MYKITVIADEEYATEEPVCEPDTESIYLLSLGTADFDYCVKVLCHELMHEIIYKVENGFSSGEWDSTICNNLEDWIWKK